MLFLFVMPISIAFYANVLIPICIGTTEMAFPRLNIASLWFLLCGTVYITVGVYVFENPVNAGWTLYPPLATRDIDSLPTSTDMAIFAIHCLGVSSMLGSINMICTLIEFRGRGIMASMVNIYLIAIYGTSFLLVAALPMLTVAVTAELLDRNVCTGIYDGPLGGDPVLYQHLF